MTIDLETLYLLQVHDAGLPNPVREYRIIPERKYRWDFCWPAHLLAVEIQGGTWSRKRTAHSSGPGIKRDCEKHNLAVVAGWKVLMFTSDMVQDGTAVEITRKALSPSGKNIS